MISRSLLFIVLTLSLPVFAGQGWLTFKRSSPPQENPNDLSTLKKIVLLDNSVRDQWSDYDSLRETLLKLFELGSHRLNPDTYEPAERITQEAWNMARRRLQSPSSLSDAEFAASVVILLYEDHTRYGSVDSAVAADRLVYYLQSGNLRVVEFVSRYVADHFVGLKPGYSFMPAEIEKFQGLARSGRLNSVVFNPKSERRTSLIIELDGRFDTWEMYTSIALDEYRIGYLGKIILSMLSNALAAPDNENIHASWNYVYEELRKAASENYAGYAKGTPQRVLAQARADLAQKWLEKVQELINAKNERLMTGPCPAGLISI